MCITANCTVRDSALRLGGIKARLLFLSAVVYNTPSTKHYYSPVDSSVFAHRHLQQIFVPFKKYTTPCPLILAALISLVLSTSIRTYFTYTSRPSEATKLRPEPHIYSTVCLAFLNRSQR